MMRVIGFLFQFIVRKQGTFVDDFSLYGFAKKYRIFSPLVFYYFFFMTQNRLVIVLSDNTVFSRKQIPRPARKFTNRSIQGLTLNTLKLPFRDSTSLGSNL